MSNMPIITMDSREVADAAGKQHNHLMRDIEKYILHLTEINQSNIGLNDSSTKPNYGISKNGTTPNFGVSDFFIKSSYVDSIGRTLPCYLITRKGCEFIANKMTGKKGTMFTAAYISKFHEMEADLAKPPMPEPQALDIDLIKEYRMLAESKDVPSSHRMPLLDAMFTQITGKEPEQAWPTSNARSPVEDLFSKRTARLIEGPIGAELYWQSLAEYALDAMGGEEHVPQFMDRFCGLQEETKDMTLKEGSDYLYAWTAARNNLLK